jgi:hypothetical protein
MTESTPPSDPYGVDHKAERRAMMIIVVVLGVFFLLFFLLLIGAFMLDGLRRNQDGRPPEKAAVATVLERDSPRADAGTATGSPRAFRAW